MKVLLDTNIILDVLLARAPFAEHSTLVVAMAESGKIDGCLCATTFTTIHYLTSKALGARKARGANEKLLNIFAAAGVDHSVLESSLHVGFSDYEDAVIHQAALQDGVEIIVTRNPKDFKKARLKVLTPIEFLALYPNG
ncbi:MAG: PIN domain-containing protein [Planctomycetes bacterium]|nr:PIN domain-containing protein [Planctomycetota bacterium]